MRPWPGAGNWPGGSARERLERWGGKISVTIITRKLAARELTVKLVDGSAVKGKINLHHVEHMIQRVSELFTQIQDSFLVVFDATLEGESGRILFINKQKIIWASPED
jgi:hypothetical protein